MHYKDIHLGTVGIDYVDTPNQLKGCVADAKRWDRRWRSVAKRHGTRIEGDATLQGILDLVDELCSKAGADDLVILTRSGHGTQVPDRNGDEPDRLDEAFVPSDYRNGLLIDDVYRLRLAKYPCSKLLIDDFCHSGTSARAFFKDHPPDVIPGYPRFIPFASLEAEMCTKAVAEIYARGGLEAVDNGVIQITGCLDTEFSYDSVFNGQPQGAATHFLNVALDSLAKPVTFAQWFATVRMYLPRPNVYPQSPQLNASEAMKNWYVPGFQPDVPVTPGPAASGEVVRYELGGDTFEVRKVPKPK